MKYHLFISNETGAEHIIYYNLSELREHAKQFRSSDVIGIIKGGTNFDPLQVIFKGEDEE